MFPFEQNTRWEKGVQSTATSIVQARLKLSSDRVLFDKFFIFIYFAMLGALGTGGDEL